MVGLEKAKAYAAQDGDRQLHEEGYEACLPLLTTADLTSRCSSCLASLTSHTRSWLLKALLGLTWHSWRHQQEGKQQQWSNCSLPVLHRNLSAAAQREGTFLTLMEQQWATIPPQPPGQLLVSSEHTSIICKGEKWTQLSGYDLAFLDSPPLWIVYVFPFQKTTFLSPQWNYSRMAISLNRDKVLGNFTFLQCIYLSGSKPAGSCFWIKIRIVSIYSLHFTETNEEKWVFLQTDMKEVHTVLMKIFYCKQNDVCASDIQNNLFLPSAKTRKVTREKKAHKNSINLALFFFF